MLKQLLIILVIRVAYAQDSTTTVSSTKVGQIQYVLDSDKEYTFTSKNYPNPYPNENQNVIIQVKNGYSIKIIVNTVDLNSDKGDFLIIKPGTNLDDESQGKVFVYTVKESRNYVIHSTSAFVSLQVLGNEKHSKKGFSISVQRIGEEATSTTQISTTDVTWPTPSNTDSIYYTGYVYSKTLQEYNNTDTMGNLKMAINEMAIQYCNANKVPLASSITTKNVHIYRLMQCQLTWPNYEKCVEVYFALPIFLNENSEWNGYQLTTKHLEKMWAEYADEYLKKYELQLYSKPNIDSMFTTWILISCITLILFLILLYFVKLITRNMASGNILKRRSSDTSGIIKNDSRLSKMSLGPHPLQVTPPFFDNDYSPQQFEPDVGVSNRTYERTLEHDYDRSDFEDSDDEIIMENFTNSRNHIEKHDESHIYT